MGNAAIAPIEILFSLVSASENTWQINTTVFKYFNMCV